MDGIESSIHFIDMMLEDKTGLAREQTLDSVIVDSAAYPSGVRDYLDGLITPSVDYTLRELGKIASEANKVRTARWVGEKLDLGQVRAQVRRASIELEEPLSVKELTEKLKNGTWRSPKELKDEGCRLSQKRISHIFEEDQEIDTRQEGNYLVGYMTEKTILKLGFSYRRRTGLEPADDAATLAQTNPDAKTISIGGTKYVFEPNETYSREKVADYLKKVEQGVFGNSKTIGRAMQHMGADYNDEVLGSALIEFINKVNGGVILISNKRKKKLVSEIGQTPSQIESLLNRPEVSAFVRTLDVFDSPYVLRKDEQEFYAAMKKLIS